MEQKTKLIKEEQVSDISLFKPIKKHTSTFKSLLKRCTRKVFNPSSVICEQGTVVDGVYLIEEGQVSIESNQELQQDAPQQPLMDVNKLQRGEIIGQKDLKQPRRTINVRAKTRTKVILIPNEIYQFLTEKLSGQLTVQHTIPLFMNLSIMNIHHLYQNSFKKKYNIRNIIYSPGEQVCFVYMIVLGSFKVQDNSRNTLYTLNQGSFFGFQDLIRETKRTNRIICTSAEGVLIQFKKQVFQSSCFSNAQTLKEFRLIMYQRQNNTKKPIRQIFIPQTPIVYPSNMLQDMEIDQERKNILRSNKVFKNIDKQYKMINTLKTYEKRSEGVFRETISSPWFKNSDKKIKMRIKQMINRSGIVSKQKEEKRNNTQHIMTRKLLKQLNYEPNKLKIL